MQLIKLQKKTILMTDLAGDLGLRHIRSTARAISTIPQIWAESFQQSWRILQTKRQTHKHIRFAYYLWWIQLISMIWELSIFAFLDVVSNPETIDFINKSKNVNNELKKGIWSSPNVLHFFIAFFNDLDLAIDLEIWPKVMSYG